MECNSPLVWYERAVSYLESGAPGETRTHNPWVRSFALNGLSSVFRSEFMLASLLISN